MSTTLTFAQRLRSGSKLVDFVVDAVSEFFHAGRGTRFVVTDKKAVGRVILVCILLQQRFFHD
jgi:hypothetical protein